MSRCTVWPMTNTPDQTTNPQPSNTEDDARREDIKAKLGQAVESLKTELSQRLDQFLDELGAKI